MASKTLQMQSAFEARFINMIHVAVAIAAGSDAGLFLLMAARAGHIVGRLRVSMAPLTVFIGWSFAGCVVMTGAAGKHVRVHRVIKVNLLIKFLQIINGYAFRSIIDSLATTGSAGSPATRSETITVVFFQFGSCSCLLCFC